jgi:hypothetical protein
MLSTELAERRSDPSGGVDLFRGRKFLRAGSFFEHIGSIWEFIAHHSARPFHLLPFQTSLRRQ